MSNIQSHLEAVRGRQRRVLVGQALAWGFIAGAASSLALLLAYWRLQSVYLLAAAGVFLLGAPLAATAIGAFRRLTWREAACAVDSHYVLKDRVLSALEFSTATEPTPFQAALVRDAMRHLASAHAPHVVPARWPRFLRTGLVAFLFAATLIVWPLLRSPAARALAEPLPEVLAEVDLLEKQVREIEDAAKDLQSEELRTLAEKFRKKIEELKEPGVDLHEAMAKVAQMQAVLASEMKEFDTPMVDEQFKDLGKSMLGAGALDAPGKALMEKQYEKAARDLDKTDSPKVDKKDGKAVAERIAQSAKQMKEKGLEQMSKATSKIADGVKGDQKKFQEGKGDLAKEIRNHDRRSRIMKLMAQEQERLRECKERCERYQRDLLERKQNPSASSNSQSAQKPSPANEKNKPGDPTYQKSNRNRQGIEGKVGDGPADVEEIEGGVPQAPRDQRLDQERYQKFLRMSEAAMESEKIPLGHRQAIRKYMELIRPSQPVESDKK